MKYKLNVKWLKNRRKLLKKKNRKNRSMLRKIGKNRNLTPWAPLKVWSCTGCLHSNKYGINTERHKVLIIYFWCTNVNI